MHLRVSVWPIGPTYAYWRVVLGVSPRWFLARIGHTAHQNTGTASGQRSLQCFDPCRKGFLYYLRPAPLTLQALSSRPAKIKDFYDGLVPNKNQKLWLVYNFNKRSHLSVKVFKTSLMKKSRSLLNLCKCVCIRIILAYFIFTIILFHTPIRFVLTENFFLGKLLSISLICRQDLTQMLSTRLLPRVVTCPNLVVIAHCYEASFFRMMD